MGFLAAIGTAVIAVIVFLAGQALLRFVIEPIQEQKKVRADVGHALLFHANRVARGVELGTFTPEQLHEASHELRDLAGRLQRSLVAVPLYDRLASRRLVLDRADVLDAASELIGWSNDVLQKDVDTADRQKRIAEKLDIARLMDVR